MPGAPFFNNAVKMRVWPYNGQRDATHSIALVGFASEPDEGATFEDAYEEYDGEEDGIEVVGEVGGVVVENILEKFHYQGDY